MAIDAKFNPETDAYEVFVNGGRQPTGLNAIEWAKEGVKRGAGELLVTSMDKDGTKSGYDIRLYQQLTAAVGVPIIASGGCGQLSDFSDVFQKTNVDGALAASVFHFGELTISDVKQQLKTDGVIVR
ncbi:imidazole glycerol phosphate synthase cyclase subunit [Lentilactobacillus farraginis DSM 18382 = JCM 14108]|uniref:Imidazole glycerol phosphate synthase cyclase subunit n=1 Tax=Lentilactobacillus farraginis DSM 18382 = JCM 14108 TaxID=1423743 RepID=X0PFR1_9LACO|nr:imidazole glycerol phosphate synthase cyclase subunit [Lentilactobacillus farraginis DSM 18382 = JCM 14108]